jgi:hypothetical protein
MGCITPLTDDIKPSAWLLSAAFALSGSLFGNAIGGATGIAVNLWLSGRVIEMGLSVLDLGVDRIYICSSRPTTYAEATTNGTYALGAKSFAAGDAFLAPADAASAGRKTTMLFLLCNDDDTTAIQAALDAAFGPAHACRGRVP